MSEPQTPQPSTRRRISPSPGPGESIVSSRKRRGSRRVADRMSCVSLERQKQRGSDMQVSGREARGYAPAPSSGGCFKLHPQPPPRPEQCAHRLAVVDLPPRRLLDRFRQGYALDREDLVVAQGLPRLLEIGCEVQPDLLVGEAGGGPDPAEGFELAGAVADLLFGFAESAGFRLLAGIELAGGDLQEVAAG